MYKKKLFVNKDVAEYYTARGTVTYSGNFGAPNLTFEMNLNPLEDPKDIEFYERSYNEKLINENRGKIGPFPKPYTEILPPMIRANF